MDPTFLHLLVIVLLTASAGGIRVSDLIVPHQVGRGQDARLHCQFTLNGHKLYSVKWFKGSHEFFRVVPNASRPIRVFPLSELTVEDQQSNVTSVLLRNIQKSNAGTYRCEVSGESPHFETDYREANMSVIDLPLQGPIIVNVQSSYQPGEQASFNCTFPLTNPPAVLLWYIDGDLAPSPYVKHYVDGSLSSGKRQRSMKDDDGSITTTVGLEFNVNLPRTSSLHSGSFAVRNVTCVALVGDIYKKETHAQLKVASGQYSSKTRSQSHLFQSNGGRTWTLGNRNGEDWGLKKIFVLVYVAFFYCCI